MGEIFQLVYLSFGSNGIGKQDVEDILQKARTKNERAGITGMLLFRSGIFIQILEGERQRVESLYTQKIQNDPRHHNLKVLLTRVSDQRLFPFWTMGYKDLEEIDLDFVDGLEAWMERFETSDQEYDLENQVDIMALFKEFRFSDLKKSS